MVLVNDFPGSAAFFLPLQAEQITTKRFINDLSTKLKFHGFFFSLETVRELVLHGQKLL